MLTRIRRSPALIALTTFVLLGGILFAWWTISPLFIRTSLDEGRNIAVPAAQATTTTAAMAEPAGAMEQPGAEATATSSATTMAQPARSSEEMSEPEGDATEMGGETPDAGQDTGEMVDGGGDPTAKAAPTAEAAGAGTMAEDKPADAMAAGDGQSGQMTGPKVFAVGSFDRKDAAHYASGQAIVARQEDGSVVVRLQDLDAANGPDLFVYVSEHPDPKNSDELHQGGHNLGGLKATNGSFNYTLDPAIDPAKLRSVVIYCRAFSVIFSVAALASEG